MVRRRLSPLPALVLVVAACGGGSASAPSADVTEQPSTTPAANSTSPSIVASDTSVAATSGAATVVADGEEWIVFQGVQGGLSLIRPDGTDYHVILGPPAQQVHPDWSPDGSQIVYVLKDENTYEIWITDPLGTDPQPLITEYPAELSGLFWDNPAWSPDGSQIAAVAYQGHPAEVFPARSLLVVVDVATGEVEVVGELAVGQAHSFPRWSPDGNAFVVSLDSFTDDAYLGGAVSIIRRSEIGWAEPVQITDVSRGPSADWHPVEDVIVFCDGVSTHPQSDESSNLFTIRPDGTEQSPITDYGPGEDRACQPTWTLDGRIIFNHNTGAEDELGSIALLNADGSGLEIVADDATTGPGNHPRLRPIP